MKNTLVLVLANTGFLNTSANSLDAKSAYALLKFRKFLSKMSETIEEKRKELIVECGLDKPEYQEKIKTSEPELTEDKKYLEAVNRFNQMFREYLDEESEIEVKPLSFDTWHNFLKENDKVMYNGTEIPFRLGNLEFELEDILWKAPESEEENS